LTHLNNINGFFLFHFEVNFGQKSLCIFLLFDHFAIFEKVLTISKKVGLEFDSLFLGRSFGKGRGAAFDEIGGFESFAGSISDGLFALDAGKNAEKVVGDGAVFVEPGEIAHVRLFSFSSILMGLKVFFSRSKVLIGGFEPPYTI
jgi:hypothetical protein